MIKLNNKHASDSLCSDIANINITKYKADKEIKYMEIEANLRLKGMAEIFNQYEKITILKRHIKNGLNMITNNISNLFIDISKLDYF